MSDDTKKRRELKELLLEQADAKATAKGVYKTMQVPEEAPTEHEDTVKEDSLDHGEGPFGSH